MQKFCKDEEKRWKLVTDDNIIEVFADDINFLMEGDDARKKQTHKQVLNSSKGKWDHNFGKTLLDPNYSGHQDLHDTNAQFKQEKDNRNVKDECSHYTQHHVFQLLIYLQIPSKNLVYNQQSKCSNHVTTSLVK